MLPSYSPLFSTLHLGLNFPSPILLKTKSIALGRKSELSVLTVYFFPALNLCSTALSLGSCEASHFSRSKIFVPSAGHSSERWGSLLSSWFSSPSIKPLHCKQAGVKAIRTMVFSACYTWCRVLPFILELRGKESTRSLRCSCLWKNICNLELGGWEMLCHLFPWNIPQL